MKLSDANFLLSSTDHLRKSNNVGQDPVEPALKISYSGLLFGVSCSLLLFEAFLQSSHSVPARDLALNTALRLKPRIR